MLLLLSYCHATTVIVIVTPQRIFVGTDGKVTSPANPKVSSRGVNKATIFQNRLIVAVLSATAIEVANKLDKGRVVFRYDFAQWIAEIEKKAPSNVSVADLTKIIENESRVAFQDLDRYIAGGALGYNKTHKTLIEYVIAGFDAGIPTVNKVYYKINWETYQLEGPILVSIFPDANGGVNFNFHIFGQLATDYTELGNRKGKSYEELVAVAPKELSKVLARQNLSLDETKRFCLALLRIQAKHFNDVGPPYSITTTVPSELGNQKSSTAGDD
jgi:hypothetical protein